MTRALALLVLALALGSAAAQPPPPAEPRAEGATDSPACLRLDLTPGASLQPPPGRDELATPIPWSEFVVEGTLLDPPATVHALLAPTLERYRTSLSASTLPEIAAVTARLGYQLVGHDSIDGRLTLRLEPLLLVRKVEVRVPTWRLFAKLFDEEIRRRMGVRAGSYLPWDPVRRSCVMAEERRRIEEYLADQGYFKAKVELAAIENTDRAVIKVNVDLKKAFTLGRVRIACPSESQRDRKSKRCIDPSTGGVREHAIGESEISAMFARKRCVLGDRLCLEGGTFTREQFQKDLQTLKEAFQKRGYPAVRIQAGDLQLAVDRDKEIVNPELRIDQRRQVEVRFEGHDRAGLPAAELRQVLTFDKAGAADEVEAAASARALASWLQERGHFDARVTWTRERIDVEPRPGSKDPGVHLDRFTFHLEPGKQRRVQSVQFVHRNLLPTEQLEDLVATKETGFRTLIGATAAATTAGLAEDVARLVEAYRRAGFHEAQVSVQASPALSGLGDGAFTAALAASDRGDDLFVRFTIDEGPPTLLERIVLVDASDQPIPRSVCERVLAALADELGERKLATPSGPQACVARVPGLRFRADAVAGSRDRVREALYKDGRPRAEVSYEAVPLGPHRVEARFRIARMERVTIGKVVIRGNFRTKAEIIARELDLAEGTRLTSDRLAEGARRLRNTALFDAVNIDMPDLDPASHSSVVHAVVRVEERYVHRAEVGVEGGYSWVQGVFGTVRGLVPNMLGRGISLQLSVTFGTRLSELDGRLRFPAWWRPLDAVPRSLDFNTDLTAFTRTQQTPRFGELQTQGAGVALSWQRSRPRTRQRAAYALGVSPFYDFRVRVRNVDAVRPIGADMDETQVAVSTRTGAVGIRGEVERRIDSSGQLAPLAPDAGFRLDGSVMWASPQWLGQNKFVKLSLSGSKFQLIGRNLLVRADVRYDHGFPLGGEVMLPEVERFFAGGDNTVRGYPEDRLKTEVVEVGVPPFDGVTQIRVLPASGNIRVLGSLDGQLRLWKVFAGAMFADAGVITNHWATFRSEDFRPAVGMGLRALTPFGIAALEYAIPLRPQLGDDPRGRIHFYFAARAQF
jgi:outer membrane protein insertion porin family